MTQDDKELRNGLVGWTALALIFPLGLFGAAGTIGSLAYGINAAAEGHGPMAMLSWFATASGIALVCSLGIAVAVWAASKSIVD